MDKISLTRKHNKADIKKPKLDGYIKWLTTHNDNAVVRVTTNIGINCILHINPQLRGSIFEFENKDVHLTVSLESLICEYEVIKGMMFGVW